jgi:histidine triad (HIT) family protein
MSTLFEKIINREIPADIVYEDELSLAFKDINPQAPIQILIIPKKPIEKLSDASIEDQALLGHLMLVAGKIAEQLNLDNTFRIIINNGAGAGQSVFHLHLHLMSGRPLSWPPG